MDAIGSADKAYRGSEGSLTAWLDDWLLLRRCVGTCAALWSLEVSALHTHRRTARTHTGGAQDCTASWARTELRFKMILRSKQALLWLALLFAHGGAFVPVSPLRDNLALALYAKKKKKSKRVQKKQAAKQAASTAAARAGTGTAARRRAAARDL